MPNWCNNYATITGPKDQIDELIVECKKSDEPNESYEILNKLRPRPVNEEENWYDWNISNWGTKWDINLAGYEVVNENTITLSFDTAWSPPIALYEFLIENNWEVDAYYYEPGMGFCGHYDGSDEYYEYGGMSADEAEEHIPDDLNEMFSITDDMRQWEEENETEVD